MLAPRSIAIVGASENVDKLGGRCLQYLQRFGFQGKIFPINPARELTQGVRSYPSFEALPEVAELAIVALPGLQAVEAIEACARHGSKVAVILSAGFGEAGAEGRAMERRPARRWWLQELARERLSASSIPSWMCVQRRPENLVSRRSSFTR